MSRNGSAERRVRPDLRRYRSEAWAWLTGPVRAALDDGGPGRRTATVDFASLPRAAAEGYANLLALRVRPSGRVRVSLPRVDAALRASPSGVSLVELLEALGGPLVGEADRRARERADADQLWVEARAHPALRRHPQLAAWLDAEHEQAGRLPSDPTRRRQVLTAALDVAAALPANGVGRSRFAWGVLRNTKALASTASDGHIRSAAIRAAAAVAGRPVPTSAEGERELWEAVGVVLDALASRVLVAGLAPDGADPVSRGLRSKGEAGLATVLTLDDVSVLLAEPGSRLAGGLVSVVENPEVVVAALAELGPRCPPVICTEGRPHLAAMRLLAGIRDRGERLRVHADFDWDGLAIAGSVLAPRAEPWRMSAADFLRAVRRASAGERPLPQLTGTRVRSAWDPELAAAMAQAGVEVHEEDENVLGDLVGDLWAEAERLEGLSRAHLD